MQQSNRHRCKRSLDWWTSPLKPWSPLYALWVVCRTRTSVESTHPSTTQTWPVYFEAILINKLYFNVITCSLSRKKSRVQNYWWNSQTMYNYLIYDCKFIHECDIVCWCDRFHRRAEADADCTSFTPKWPAARLSLCSEHVFKQKCLQLVSECTVVC